MCPTVVLAVDAMGGDFGPRVTVPAALNVANLYPSLRIKFFGDRAQIEQHMEPSLARVCSNTAEGCSNAAEDCSNAAEGSNATEFAQRLIEQVSIVHTDDVVKDTDQPATVLRHGHKTSLWQSIESVSTGAASACVSAGNTGALMAVGRYLLKMVGEMERPAICKAIPTARGESYLLDLGANIKVSEKQLIQFALMGSVMAQAKGKARPKVALLNIGGEETKGSDSVKAAAAVLKQHELIDYIGFVEGDDLFEGVADVVACDGLLGNVALKTSEGVARYIVAQIAAVFHQSFYARLIGRLAKPLLRSWQKKIDPARYNGASFLGLNGVLIKSHGGAETEAFAQALVVAKEHVEQEVTMLINNRLSSLS